MGLGELFAAGCALSWAIAVILLKKSGEQLPPLALNLVKGAMVLPLFAVTVVVAEGAAWPVIGWGTWAGFWPPASLASPLATRCIFARSTVSALVRWRWPRRCIRHS